MSIQTSFPVSMELFTSYREIATDQSKAGKVIEDDSYETGKRGLRTDLSGGSFSR